MEFWVISNHCQSLLEDCSSILYLISVSKQSSHCSLLFPHTWCIFHAVSLSGEWRMGKKDASSVKQPVDQYRKQIGENLCSLYSLYFFNMDVSITFIKYSSSVLLKRVWNAFPPPFQPLWSYCLWILRINTLDDQNVQLGTGQFD